MGSLFKNLFQMISGGDNKSPQQSNGIQSPKIVSSVDDATLKEDFDNAVISCINQKGLGKRVKE